MPLFPPLPTEEQPQHFCADKGYDYPDVRSLIGFMQMVDHIKSRGEETSDLRLPGYRARRWVCERTHSWMNRFRRLLIRWEKKRDNFLAFLSTTALLWPVGLGESVRGRMSLNRTLPGADGRPELTEQSVCKGRSDFTTPLHSSS